MAKEENLENKNGTEKKKSSKSCLIGCLGTGLLLIVLITGTGFWVYSNRGEILTKVSTKMGTETLPFLVTKLGSEVESPISKEHINSTYQFSLPEGQGTIKVSDSSNSVEATDEEFVKYFSEENWQVDKIDFQKGDWENIQQNSEVPEHIKNFVEQTLEKSGNFYVLEKDGEERVMAVMQKSGGSYVVIAEDIKNIELPE
ncbi:MAG: hypothetical protein ACQEQC_04750 [Elusimicrobiota bacterium]